MKSPNIRIYKLVDVAIMVENEHLIRSLFYEILKVPKNSEGHHLSVSTMSGWINYANTNELYSKRTNKRLSNKGEEAEKEVMRFMQAVNNTFNSDILYKKTGLPLPFHPGIFHIESTLVFKPDSFPNVDHWLIKFGFRIDNGQSASSVFGAALEIRVGNNNNTDFSHIIGFSLRWTPYVRYIYDDIVTMADEPTGKHHEPTQEHHKQDEKPVIAYKLDGESFPQNILSPFYINPSGHHLEFTPASKKYSIVAQILEVENERGKQLFPSVNGGSGDFIFQWAVWEQGNFQSSLKIIEGDSIFVDIGVHNVALHIIDQKTSVTLQTQSTIYALGNEEFRYRPTFEPIKLGCIHPLATNYDPQANEDDPSNPCIFPSPPSV